MILHCPHLHPPIPIPPHPTPPNPNPTQPLPPPHSTPHWMVVLYDGHWLGGNLIRFIPEVRGPHRIMGSTRRCCVVWLKAWVIFVARVFIFSALLNSGKRTKLRLWSVGFKARSDQTDHCYGRGSSDIKHPPFFYLYFYTSQFYTSRSTARAATNLLFRGSAAFFFSSEGC